MNESTGIIIVWIFLAAGIVYFFLPLLYGRWKRHRLRQEARKKRVCVITFDDGPGTRLTPRILTLLEQHGVKASFFLLGRNIMGREEIVRQIHAGGHEIGSHGFNHLHAWKVWPWQTVRDIRKGWREIDQALGMKHGTYPYRPPYGKLNLIALLYLWIKRIPIFYWTVESKDTWTWQEGAPSMELVAEQISEGGILLLHDFDRSDEERDPYVFKIVELTLNLAHEKNLQVVSMSRARDLSL